jgi:hypothetical protein
MLFGKSAVPKNMDECFFMSLGGVASFSNIRFRNITL